MTIDKNLVQRTLAGIVFLAVMIFCICWNEITAASIFVIVGALGAFEMVKMVYTKTGTQKHLYITAGLAGLAGLFIQLSFFRELRDWHLGVYAIVFVFLAFTLLFLLPDAIEKRLVKAVVFIFSLLYIILPFVIMHAMLVNFGPYNYTVVLILFVFVWTNDTMAYVCGRLLGKHPLAPAVSPKKTWEGFIGGIVFTIIASCIIAWITGYPFDRAGVWVLPLAVGVFSTIGDLFESTIKRWAGVKDSGNLIPGHGGILDRFDGAIFAVWPFCFLFYFFA